MQLEQENSGLRAKVAGLLLPQCLVTHAPIILFVFDQDGVITASEGNALLSTGRIEGEILGRSFFEVFADVLPRLL